LVTKSDLGALISGITAQAGSHPHGDGRAQRTLRQQFAADKERICGAASRN
jgi:hypothetical protein